MSKFNRQALSCLIAISIAFQPLLALAQSRSAGVIETLIKNSNIQRTDVSSDRTAIEAEGASLQQALLGQNPYHPLDTFRLLAQESIDIKANPYRMDLSALTVEILDSKGQVVGQLSPRMRNSFYAKENSEFYFQLSYQDKTFLKFKAPVDSIGFVGENLVFTEANSVARGQSEERLEHLNFIDLKKFKNSIGQYALPIFKVAVQAQEDHQLRMAKSGLSLNGVVLNESVLKVYSDAQEVALNVSACLVDPACLERAEPLLDNFQTYFTKNLELQESTVQEQIQLLSGGMDRVKKFGSQLQIQISRKEAFPELDAIASNINKNTAAQKKLVGRLKMLWGALALPQPQATPKLATAMAIVASGIRQKKPISTQEVAYHVLNNKSLQMGLAISTGLAVGASHPAETAAFFYSGLDATRTVFDLTFGQTKNLAYMVKESFLQTIEGFSPVAFKNAYLNSEMLPKLGVGLAAIMTSLYVAIGVPHILTNTFYLVRDFKKVNWSERIQKEGHFFKAISSAFIERQKNVQKQYLASLSQDSKAGAQSVTFSEEDNENVRNEIARLKEKEKSGFLTRWLKKAFERKEPQKTKNIETFAQAVRHFLFSFATFTISGKAYTQIWNSWFGIRSFIWHPSIVAMTTVFPQFWNLAVQGRVANELNGGTRTRLQEIRLKISDRQRLAEIEQWENAFLKAEGELSRWALQATLKALVENTQNNKTMQELFKSSGAKNISDESLMKLDQESRSFFNYYYNQLLEKSSFEFLRRRGFHIDANRLNDLKSSQAISQLALTAEEAREIVSQEANQELISDVRTELNKVFSFSAAKTQFLTEISSRLHPDNNRQVKRMTVVNNQADKPQAMARAVRGMIASNLVDKPLELMFLFLCFAGAQSDLLRPIQDEMFSENSWFHLSKMLFTNGFIYGVISGVFADIWMKLQMDELNEGKFESVPTGQDAEGSFLKYYFKKTFKNPENSLWRNHKHNVKIIWANMKAAFTTMAAVGLLTLGRFDIDAYIVGYLFAYFTPLSAFSMKLEQGFELASSYFAKDISEKYRSHPLAQEYLNTTISKKRLWFNFFYKTYENLMGNFTMTLQNGKTALLGSRSFSRWLLGGFTFTEASTLGLRSAGEMADKVVSGASRITDACEHLLTNNYTDWEKAKPKVGP